MKIPHTRRDENSDGGPAHDPEPPSELPEEIGSKCRWFHAPQYGCANHGKEDIPPNQRKAARRWIVTFRW